MYTYVAMYTHTNGFWHRIVIITYNRIISPTFCMSHLWCSYHLISKIPRLSQTFSSGSWERSEVSPWLRLVERLTFFGALIFAVTNENGDEMGRFYQIWGFNFTNRRLGLCITKPHHSKAIQQWGYHGDFYVRKAWGIFCSLASSEHGSFHEVPNF